MRITRIVNNKQYFSIFIPEKGSYRYLGSETNEEVLKIKEAHYLAASTKGLLSEISATEKYLRKSTDVAYEDINARLSKVYQNPITVPPSAQTEKAATWKKAMEEYKASFPPFRPEELIHPTHDKTMVRSKSEALIYNYLLEMGVTFIYEAPLKITVNNKKTLLLPDFTILSEIDYKTVIYIEHQGMMSLPQYRSKFNDAVYKYWLNNYLPEKDVFFTFDTPNGVLNDQPIKNIISRYVRPIGS